MQFIKIFDSIYNSIGLNIHRNQYDGSFYITVYSHTMCVTRDYLTAEERDAAFDKIEKQLNPFIVEV